MTNDKQCELCGGTGEIETQNVALQDVTVGCPECMERDWQSQQAQGHERMAAIETANKIIKIGAQAERANAKSNSCDGSGGTRATEEFLRLRSEIVELIYSPAPVAVPDDLANDIRARASAAYCSFIDKMRSTECLGVDAKIASGKFGRDDLNSHCKAHELLGEHKAFSAALKMLDAAPTDKDHQQAALFRAHNGGED